MARNLQHEKVDRIVNLNELMNELMNGEAGAAMHCSAIP